MSDRVKLENIAVEEFEKLDEQKKSEIFRMAIQKLSTMDTVMLVNRMVDDRKQ